MKKISFFLFLCFGFYLNSQNIAEVFKSKTLVYYGLDFSHAILIGDFGMGGTSVLKYKMTSSWNEVIVKEKNKYNLNKAFSKREVLYDLTPIVAQNEKIEESTFNPPVSNLQLNPEIIPHMVSELAEGEIKDGLGVIFIVDRFDKNVGKGFVYITFFDIRTKQVYFSELVKGGAGGVGLRNYWAASIYNMLKSIESNKYDSWENKYLR